MLADHRIHASFCTIIAVLSMLPSGALGRGADVSFKGTITRIEQTSAGRASVSVRLTGFDVAVLVDSETDIESHGDKVGITGLQVGMFVRVAGNFGSGGIVAREIHILDGDDSEFRLRGTVTAVSTSAGGIQLTLLGITVFAGADTPTERRGPGGGIGVLQIVPGMEADVRGIYINGTLTATRIKIGNREDDPARVRFEGRISTIENGRMLVDTEGGGNAVVLITGTTRVKGSLAVGRQVEVKGFLNAQLEVVAETVKVDGVEEPGDEDEFKKEIRLNPVPAGLAMRGKAEVELEEEGSRSEQEFEVEIEKAAPNSDFGIRVEITGVGFLDFGTLRSSADGKARAEFSTDAKPGKRDLKPLLTGGKSVRDFIRVQVVAADGQTVLLEGRF